jgi:uncharacterized membrane protein YkvA (DUF1232 family)
MSAIVAASQAIVDLGGAPTRSRRPFYAASVSQWRWLLVVLAVTLVAYLVLVLALVLAGRRGDARAVAGFIPDSVVLFKRLLADPRVSWWQKSLLAGLIAYLAMPIDLVPDFIPVAGQLDDAILVAVVLRTVLRASGESLLREHWPGPERSLSVIRRLAYGTPPDASGT